MIRHSVLHSGFVQVFMSNIYSFILSLAVFSQLFALPDSMSFFLSFTFARSSVSNILQQSQLCVQNFKHSSGIGLVLANFEPAKSGEKWIFREGKGFAVVNE
jgi:hypothetical protein